MEDVQTLLSSHCVTSPFFVSPRTHFFPRIFFCLCFYFGRDMFFVSLGTSFGCTCSPQRRMFPAHIVVKIQIPPTHWSMWTLSKRKVTVDFCAVHINGPLKILVDFFILLSVYIAPFDHVLCPLSKVAAVVGRKSVFFVECLAWARSRIAGVGWHETVGEWIEM